MTSQGPPAPPPPPPRFFRPPQPGQAIAVAGNTYVIGQPLGEGAFASTFACSDDWTNQLVVKVLVPRGQHTYEQIRANWEREINSLLALRHPNITYVHDAFEFEDTFYIVVERCAGPITQLFQIPQYSGLVWVQPIARCLLQAVHYMHLNDYVHKDIHPGNVLYSFVRNELVPTYSNSLTFKVGDLGIARLEADIDIFNTTLAQWMLPPEFLDGQFGMVGKATDIYHAALLLLSVVKGAIPVFDRAQITAGAPREMAEALGTPVGAALGRALRRHVAARTPSAFAFWKDLSA